VMSSYLFKKGVAFVKLSNPPVNALGLAVRSSMSDPYPFVVSEILELIRSFAVFYP
jgi:hypothetical protein